MGSNPLEISISKHKFNALCAKDCNPSLNLNHICNGACFQICPLLCKTLYFRQDIFPPIPSIPPLIIRRPATETGNLPQPNTIAIIMIIIAVFLGAAIIVCFFICFLSFYVRQRRERRERDQDQPVFFGTQEDFLDEDQRPGMDHHVWYINTVGLQQSVIDLIAVFKYKKDDFFSEGTECSVCLSEFMEDESLKVLPKCSHAFHVHCIDTWLTSHKNCPLCRAPIISDDFDSQVGLDSSFNSTSYGSTRLLEGEEGTSGTVNEDGSGCLMLDKDETTCSNSATKLDVLAMSRPNDNVSNGHKEVRNLARSMSLDSSSAAQGRVLQPEDLKRKKVWRAASYGGGSSRKLVKSTSIGHALNKGPISMKRSFLSAAKSSSCSSSSRRHRSILPL